MKVLRRIAAVIVGLIIAAVLVQLAEIAVHAMHPFPPGLNEHDFNQVKKYVSTLPIDALLVVLAGWLLGTIAGTFTAAKIGATRTTAYILGAILFCLGMVNAVIIPQPLWFTIASLVIYAGGAVVGGRLGGLVLLFFELRDPLFKLNKVISQLDDLGPKCECVELLFH